MLERLRELVNNVDKKDEENALEIMRILSKEYWESGDMLVYGNTYYVSQWSWTPIVDGIYSYETTIRRCGVKNNVFSYFTGTNYRVYFPWDIYNTKEECDEACNLKSQFGYDWDIAHVRFSKANTF